MCAFCLLCGQGSKHDQHGGIHGLHIIEEDTNDFLHMFAIGSIKGSCVVRFRGVLDFGAIGGSLPGMQQMFWALWVGGAELHEGLFNVPGHGNVNSVLIVIPLEHEATIAGCLPIFGDLVMGMECT